ncbi:MAG: amino acid adenylation domain-containing protein [Hyphomicrobiaceae bacterium]|nr:amino acid adenylation domain-containing protein [Hyphomicrobiaceae bacterium]
MQDEAISSLLRELESCDIRVLLDGERLRLNAPKGAVDDRLRSLIAANRELLIAHLRAQAEAGSASSLPRVPRTGRLPVSFAQQRLWFLDRVDPGRSHYNILVAFRIDGRLDGTAFERSLEALARRHESLRTRVGERDGAPWIEVDDGLLPPLERRDLRGMPAAGGEAEAHRIVLGFSQEPFDLARGPLARHLLVTLDAEVHVFATTVHHIVGDGWSASILSRELMQLYEAYASGREPDLPAPAQYIDYAGWEQRLAREGRFAPSLEFWKRQLAGAPSLLELPTDRPRPTVQSFRGRRMRRSIDAELLGQLKELARREGSTLFVVLLSAWQVLLHRYSGQDDIPVGSAAANRSMPDLESIMGCLANTIVLRGRLDGNPSFRDYMKSAKATVFDALDHQSLPFDHLVEALNPARSTSHTPIFQVFFTLMSFPISHASPHGLRLSQFETFAEVARFDLALDAVEHEGELKVYYEFATDLFDESTVDRLHVHYRRLLEALAAAPDTAIDEVDFLGPDERAMLLERFNATSLDHDRGRTLHALLERSAAERPAAIAAIDAGETLTYEALDRRANRLAHHLAGLGVGRGARVAVCIDRTVDMPVALAAVLKAGAAYVPLDPSHPRERLRTTLEDAGVSAIVTLDRYTGLLEDCGAPLVRLDRDAERIAAMPAAAPDVAVAPSDLAYVIYTSGSTGRPKGVEVEHRNVVAFLEAMRRAPGLAADDCLLAVTTLSFDIAGLELWLPLSVGARIVIAARADALDGERLASLMDEHAVTLLQATPATWRLLLEAGWGGRRQIKALVGGEALPRDLAAALVDRVGELWNMYGPTETTIWSTAARVTDPESGISIGRPIANTRCYVLTPGHGVCPIGVAGELCIGGEGVARGYRDRPELTAVRFVTVPLAHGGPERIYKTGDMARMRADGTLEYLGRRDAQVKIRGYRIELGDVEAALAALAGVKESVAAAREEKPGDVRLVGYVTLQPGASFEAEAARSALRARLPEYMVPNAFAVLDALPLTPNGKIDRKALPAPRLEAPRQDGPSDAVMTPAQRRVAELWREILHLDRVGLHDNFFDLGGHSLLLVKLHVALKREFASDVALVELFQHTTVHAQAARMARQRGADAALARASDRAMRQAGRIAP